MLRISEISHESKTTHQFEMNENLIPVNMETDIVEKMLANVSIQYYTMNNRVLFTRKPLESS